MKRRLDRSMSAAFVLGMFLLAIGGQPIPAQGFASSSSSFASKDDRIVRPADGRIDYIVELDPEAPAAYPKSLIRPTHFAPHHKPQVVNVVADLEIAYGIKAHNMTSWSSTSFTAFLSDGERTALE